MPAILQNSCYLLLNPSFPFTSLPLNPKPLKLTIYYSQNTTQTETHNNHPNIDIPKKKRKPRPSFYDQIHEKWSVKSTSQTHKFPWQVQEKVQTFAPSKIMEKERKASSEIVVKVQEKVVEEPIFDHGVESFRLGNRFEEPWKLHEKEQRNLSEMVGENQDKGESVSGFDYGRNVDRTLSKERGSSSLDDTLDSSSFCEKNKFIDSNRAKFGRNGDNYSRNEIGNGYVELGSNLASDEIIQFKDGAKLDVASNGVEEDRVTLYGSKNDVYNRNSSNDEENYDDVYILNSSNDEGNYDDVYNENFSNVKGNSESYVSSGDKLPWMPEIESPKRSKTELAEKTIPEHELNRLRNVALRMKERIKVGVAGVTQAVVDEIREKWKIDEVVKLKFEGPPAFHMKRSHEVLESKTGGLVIWRSGSSVVLYRGLTYNLDCVNSYMKKKRVNSDNYAENSAPEFVRLQKSMSPEELEEMSEIDRLLDGLGPRYMDWSGRPPLPVDADLLPGFVPGYRPPFRRLPRSVLRSLKDSETTKIRRQARFIPAHFALGRNRDLQGLAAAMVKLWEKSALAKISIKRGVLNTRNERMAEELKRLTGGTLLSRNKEFIVFYRGNDFMPPVVTEALKERENLALLQFEEEEIRRYGSELVHSTFKDNLPTLVAGTLAETVAATSRWSKQKNTEGIDKMIKESALARRASLVKSLQKKQTLANAKLRKAEKALDKVQKYLIPEELPTDSELITDEERLVLRRMGLSMKPYLLLGRREVFDGTIENMHLHWKHRELVKIVVKGKSFPQIKHIAISLEAESGGVLVSIDKTTKGYNIIFYRGKNYRRPDQLKPRNLLTRRQALARSIELQRRESLKHHIRSLQEQLELVKAELEDMKDGKELDDKTFYEKLDDSSIPSDDESEEDEDEDEEAYLLTYDSGDERGVI